MTHGTNTFMAPVEDMSSVHARGGRAALRSTTFCFPQLLQYLYFNFDADELLRRLTLYLQCLLHMSKLLVPHLPVLLVSLMDVRTDAIKKRGGGMR